jgi:signal transduction histidine kinase
MSFPVDYRRLLRASGFVIWGIVGFPVAVFQLAGARVPRPILPIASWAAAYLLFGVCLALATSPRRGESGKGAPLLLAAGQAAAVLALVALPPCFGLEGALLVVVALELGAWIPRRPAAAWILLQSAALLAVVWLHWGWHWGIVLAGAYLPFQLIAYATARLLAEETASRVRLAAANAELEATRELLAQSARIAERARIARDLHDLVGHHLTALSLNLEVASHLAGGDALKRIETAQSVTKLLLGDVREAVGTLREARGLDLPAALRKLGEGMMRPRVHVDLAEGFCVEDAVAGETVLRCAQEIVTNAVRHASAENVWLEIHRSREGIALRARDDGRGAASVQSGHGLSGMRERLEQSGGRLSVETSPGRGFSIEAILPMAQGAS